MNALQAHESVEGEGFFWGAAVRVALEDGVAEREDGGVVEEGSTEEVGMALEEMGPLGA